jgi:hypothetical protein
MSNVRKFFRDSNCSNNVEISCYEEDVLFLVVSNNLGKHIIELNVSTAIAFSKELRKEINEAKGI